MQPMIESIRGATCMSFPRRAMLPSAHHLGGQGKELFLLRVHSDALAILGDDRAVRL